MFKAFYGQQASQESSVSQAALAGQGQPSLLLLSPPGDHTGPEQGSQYGTDSQTGTNPALVPRVFPAGAHRERGEGQSQGTAQGQPVQAGIKGFLFPRGVVQHCSYQQAPHSWCRLPGTSCHLLSPAVTSCHLLSPDRLRARGGAGHTWPHHPT